MQRGEIRNRARARQLRDYSGMRFGNITPTDIDGLIEYHGKGYVIIELKWGDSPLEFGQRLALERLADDLSSVGKPTLCIIASHDNDNPDEDIDAANSLVAEFRMNGKWIRSVGRTTRELTKRFIENKLNSPKLDGPSQMHRGRNLDKVQ